MSQALTVAKEEWRYWLRSRLVQIGLIVFALLLIVTSILTEESINRNRRNKIFEINRTVTRTAWCIMVTMRFAPRHPWRNLIRVWML